MTEGLRSAVERAKARCERLVVRQNVIDSRIDSGAQEAIFRMARGSEKQRVNAIGLLAAIKLGKLDNLSSGDDTSDIEQALDREFANFRENYEEGVALAAAPGVNPWMCALLCALCAAAILDGAPGDEIPVCALCMNACARPSA